MIVVKSLLAFLLLSIGSEMAAADTCVIGNNKQTKQHDIMFNLDNLIFSHITSSQIKDRLQLFKGLNIITSKLM